MAGSYGGSGGRSGPRVGPLVGVVGPSAAAKPLLTLADEVGSLLAQAGAVVVCGGLGGVMEAACRGAASAGGLSIGLLPGSDRGAANPNVSIPLATGLGEMRNALLVRCADAIIGVGGSPGTLSEIALAARMGKPVVWLAGWDVPELHVDLAASPEGAVASALHRIETPRTG
jgi:uncharacterized protein (TIGR00725 family)